jgi:mRNA-degrading endonuclease toxin of MazEF toxin-antitoxin module
LARGFSFSRPVGTGGEAVNRGEVYWVDFGGNAGMRPGVVLTRPAGLRFLTSATFGPMTTTTRNSPSWVNVGIKDGLPEDGAINLDSILTVELRHVKQLICQLSTTRMAQIDQAARFALALDSPPED